MMKMACNSQVQCSKRGESESLAGHHGQSWDAPAFSHRQRRLQVHGDILEDMLCHHTVWESPNQHAKTGF